VGCVERERGERQSGEKRRPNGFLPGLHDRAGGHTSHARSGPTAARSTVSVPSQRHTGTRRVPRVRLRRSDARNKRRKTRALFSSSSSPRSSGTGSAGAGPGARLSACASGWSCPHCPGPGKVGGVVWVSNETKAIGQTPIEVGSARRVLSILSPLLPHRTRNRILAFLLYRPRLLRTE